MIPWVLLDTAEVPGEVSGEVPGGGGSLRLLRRGEEYAIRLGLVELMNSRRGTSEAALATLSCRKIAGRPRPHVLVGGLGMGFTLRAALRELPAEAGLVVAELVPAVVAWARGPMAGIFGDCLDDPRVEIRQTDVAPLIAAGRARFDAILLDVDNGPDGLTRKANNHLYGREGLRSAREALRPGGVLAIWSAAPDNAFAGRLQASGFDVEERRVHATPTGRGVRHIIWLATRRD